MNIDALVERFYKKADNEDLINEVLKFLLIEQDAGMPPKAIFEWSMIPDIPISEIGWSDVTTTEGGEQILGPQRALLQQYLDNIGSADDTFEGQIKSLQKFYGPTGPADIMASAQSNADAISKLISYLVFYKTLTKVVTNFNAASAGFTFEAFLATLLHGTQIPANTGTIADFVTGDKVPISLKLYAEKTLKVGGSYRDLVRDLRDPKPEFSHPAEGGAGMRYVVCTKNITGEGLRQKGGITFYQFDFTLDNVFDILAFSMAKSQKNIWLPARYVAAVKEGGTLDFSSTLPSVAQYSPEDLEKQFIENFRALLKSDTVTLAGKSFDLDVRPEMLDPSFPSEEEIQEILQEIDYAKKEDYFSFAPAVKVKEDEEPPPREVVRGISLMKADPLSEIARNLYIANVEQNPDRNTKKVPGKRSFGFLGKRLAAANAMIVGSLKAAEMKALRQQALDGAEWVTDLEDLKTFYKELSVEEKRQALLNSYGFLNEEQFDLNRAQSTTPGAPIFSQKLGTILIGGALVEQMLKNVSALLNGEIYSVFASLKTLSDSLNGFFASGLSDAKGGLATQAISSAQEIEKKTTELKGEK